MTAPAIVLDCDPGIDDAFAIFCALRHAELLAVTTVDGNVDVENTTRNARYLLDLAGAPSVPVHRGASRPIRSTSHHARQVHGPSGLGLVDVPDGAVPEAATSAVDALLALSEPGGLCIVATGPLTNLALAIEQDRSFADRVGPVHWMGGAIDAGNVTAKAEFNSWHDADAVEVCLRAGLELPSYGLDLTRQVRMGSHHIAALRRLQSPTAILAADLLEYYEAHGTQDGLGQPMHDPCAVLGLTHPQLFSFERAPIVVSTEAETRGETRIASADNPAAGSITLARSVDAAAAITEIMRAAEHPLANG